MQYTYSKQVNSEKLEQELLVSSLASIYSHITTVSSPLSTTIHSTRELTSEEISQLESIVTSHTTSPSPAEYVQSVITAAITFGNQLVISFAAENVLLGITQTNKTKEVSDYLANVLRYIQSGSLYEVINEINRLETEGLPSELSPFVTTSRLLSFKNKVEAYLGIPLSE